MIHSEGYNVIKEFFHNPEVFSTKIEKGNIINKNQEEGNIIYKLDKCLQEALELVDRKNELKYFRMQLAALKEYVTNRKLRIVFLGNISVGKSSIINTIIGKEIIPTKTGECTYRGVIIRHEDSDEYKLYSTKLIEKGEGLGKFSYFDCVEFICKGIKNIKEHLENKNNDKININKNDAFFLLTGKLKIFEYININKNIIEEIEFVDLPGVDKEENDFNQKKYNTNVLRFSNCCVYVNVSNSVKDETGALKIKEQYESDKDKIFITLRPKFIKTCLFLMNKSDELEQENGKIKPSEKERINNQIYDIIKDNNSDEILKKNDLNICYFSSYFFMEYLKVKEKYVDLLENNPQELFTDLNNDYISNTPSESFLEFIEKKIVAIETRFCLTSECNSLENEKIKPKEFKLKIKNILKNYGIGIKDRKELLKKLYILKEALKIKDFSDTNYSNEHYKKIEKLLINSLELRKENFMESLNHYLAYTDILFKKKIIENPNEVEIEKTKKYSEMYLIIENLKEMLNKKEENLMNIMEIRAIKILEYIDDEIKNISDRLKETNYDIKKANEKLTNKIEEEIKNMNNERLNEIKELNNEIKTAIFQIKNSEEKEYENKNSKIDKNEIQINKSILDSFLSLIKIIENFDKEDSPLKNAIFNTLNKIHPLLGDIVKIGINVLIEVAKFVFKKLAKNQNEKNYNESLLIYKEKMEKTLKDYIDSRNSDFIVFKESFIISMNMDLELAKKDITISAENEKKTWEKLKLEYEKIKDEYEKEVIPFLC